MIDADCIAFLQWALPQLQLRWPGFRKVRRQVCRRIDKRRAELGLPDVAAYRSLLEATRDEWRVLDALCRVTISRFARDHSVWSELVTDVLPQLARDARRAGCSSVHAWSAGCAAGEEPFTLAIAWALGVAHAPDVSLNVLATDTDDVELARAVKAVFPSGALRELTDDWRRAAFEREDGCERLRDQFRAPVHFMHHDVRTPAPGGPFDLVLCRNLAFTYFDEAQQRQVAESLCAALRVGGILVVGIHEHVPDGVPGLLASARCMYRRARHAHERETD